MAVLALSSPAQASPKPRNAAKTAAVSRTPRQKGFSDFSPTLGPRLLTLHFQALSSGSFLPVPSRHGPRLARRSVKGGHTRPGGHRVEQATDVLYDGQTWHTFTAERLDPGNTHGTGCTLSAAIAANLALGKGLVDAVREAKAYVTRCIRHAPGLGHGTGPMNHFPPA